MVQFSQVVTYFRPGHLQPTDTVFLPQAAQAHVIRKRGV